MYDIKRKSNATIKISAFVVVSLVLLMAIGILLVLNTFKYFPEYDVTVETISIEKKSECLLIAKKHFPIIIIV